MAVGFPTKANWAAGDVLTASAIDDLAGTVNLLSPAGITSGYALTANGTSNSVTWTALTSTNPTANPVLNSALNVWARGTTFTATNNAYTADRWCAYTGASTNSTITRQATNDTTNLPFIQYALRYQRNATNSGTANQFISQSFETINSISFAGKTVVFSFYARAGANYSAASSALNASLVSGTGTDQNVLTGFTGQATVASGAATLTTTWQRFSYSGTVASTATQLGVQFYFTPVGVALTNDYFEITGVQIDIGSTAQAFRPNGNTYETELAACQRYYYRVGGSNTNETFGIGVNTASTTNLVLVNLPAQMRVAPTALDYSSLQITDNYTYGTALTAAALFNNGNSKDSPLVQGTVASGLTTGQLSFIRSAATTSGYLGFSAEL